MSQSVKTKLIEVLYIFLTIMIILMVAKGYGDMYLLSVAQQVALQEYEESLALLKTKVKELEKASLEVLQKEEGGSRIEDNQLNSSAVTPVLPETGSSSGIENIYLVDPNVLQGVLFFIVTITVVYFVQQDYVKRLIISFLSNSSLANAPATSIPSLNQDINVPAHSTTTEFLDTLIGNLDSLRRTWGSFGYTRLTDGRSIDQAFQERIDALMECKTILERADRAFEIQNHLGVLMVETRSLLYVVLQGLASLEARTHDVAQTLAMLQDAEATFVIATVVSQ